LLILVNQPITGFHQDDLGDWVADGLQNYIVDMDNMSAISLPSALVLGSSPQKVVSNMWEQF